VLRHQLSVLPHQLSVLLHQLSVLPHPQPGVWALRQLERSVLRHQLRQPHSEVRKLTPLAVLRQPERLARQRLPPSAPQRLLDLVEELHSLVPRSLGLDLVLQPQPLSARRQLHSVLLHHLLSVHPHQLLHQLSVLRHQLSVLLHQLSVLLHQLSVLLHQLSVLLHQLSVLLHQLSVLLHHLLSVLLLEAHKALAIQDTPRLTTTNQKCSL
jgi:hypothetical protein